MLLNVSLRFQHATPDCHGMMHVLHLGSQHPRRSSVTFFSNIGIYSRAKICILSTVYFICNHLVILIFDLPLYWIAAEIIDAPQNSCLKGIFFC